MSREQHMLPVWFFIGVLLAVYGVIILSTAIYEFSRPSTVVLAQYHPDLWGGVILLLTGSFYTVRFWPRKQKGM